MKLHIWKYFHRNEIGFGIFYSYYYDCCYLQFNLLFWGIALQFIRDKKKRKKKK